MPNVCNSALNLLKLFGRYIRMTSVLHSISEQVIASIIELFDYFLYLVFDLFAHDPDTSSFEVKFVSSRLQDAVGSIRSRLIIDQANENVENGGNIISKYHTCIPSPSVQLNNPDTLFSLPERIVAVESMLVSR